MAEPSSSFPRSKTTLALSTLLHAFTHAYATMLVPLYLLMVQDLHLKGVQAVSLIVTVYGLVYCLAATGPGCWRIGWIASFCCRRDSSAMRWRSR